MTQFLANLNPWEVVHLCDLIVQEPVALEKWSQVVNHLIPSAVDSLKIKRLLEKRDMHEAVLLTLQRYRSIGDGGPDLLLVLRKYGMNLLAGRIEDVYVLRDRDAGPGHGLWFEVDQVVYNFTGRREELNRLHIMLAEDRSMDSMDANMVCISGLGGVGKTTLARKYAYQKAELYDGNVIWINAETYDSMRNSFIRLAVKLGIGWPTDPTNHQSPYPKKSFGGGDRLNSLNEDDMLIAKVYARLTLYKYLIIFDNLDKMPDNAFRKFKPKLLDRQDIEHCFFIGTSRHADLAPRARCNLRLDVFMVSEAVHLILKELPRSKPQDAEALSERLQSLPLALQQALAYIKDNYLDGELQIPNYLREYDKAKERLLGDKTFQEHDTYVLTVLTTWNITLQKLIDKGGATGRQAHELINCLSFLNPDRISVQFLDNLFGVSTEGSLKMLHKLSMINVHSFGRNVSIHRLVQDVLRLGLTMERKASLTLRIYEHLLIEFREYLTNPRPRAAESPSEIFSECLSHGVVLLPLQIDHRLLSRTPFEHVLSLFECLSETGNFKTELDMATLCAAEFERLYGKTDERTMAINIFSLEASIYLLKSPVIWLVSVGWQKRITQMTEFQPHLAKALIPHVEGMKDFINKFDDTDGPARWKMSFLEVLQALHDNLQSSLTHTPKRRLGWRFVESYCSIGTLIGFI